MELRCLICDGEIVVLKNDKSVSKKVECLDCGFTNVSEKKKQKIEPEIYVIKRR